MSDRPDPFELLRNNYQAPSPTPEDKLRAWARLEEAMAATAQSKRRVQLVRWWPRLATVALVLALVTTGVGLVRSNAARATLLEIAEASRRASPLDIPDGSFVYTRSEHVDLGVRPGVDFGLDQEFVGYLVPTTRESWHGSDREFVQLRTTVGQPQFFTSEVEVAYYASGLDIHDRVGETILQRDTGVNDPLGDVDWPIEAAQLRQAMENYVSDQGDSRPIEARLLGLAVDLLRERNPSPALRAAIIQVLAGLPLELLEVDAEGAATFAITYRSPLLTRDTVTIGADGYLFSEASRFLEADRQSGIPAGTDVVIAVYDEPRTVDGLSG
jgi:hypothetical protein